jgi:hypothetical protein
MLEIKIHNLERELLERQETINNMAEQRRELKSELLAQTRARHLLTLRIENAVSYLMSEAHHAPRIAAALVQLKQGLNGR